MLWVRQTLSISGIAAAVAILLQIFVVELLSLEMVVAKYLQLFTFVHEDHCFAVANDHNSTLVHS